MTVETAYTPLSYSGNSVTNSFAITWPFQDAAQIVANTLVIATGIDTLLVYGTDYSITPILNSPASTGTLTLLTGALPTGTDILITRLTPVTQDTSWINNAVNPASAFENAVDKLTMEVQEVLNGSFPDSTFGIGSATTDTFLRGGNPRTWSNTLISPNNGAFVVPADPSALFTVGKAGYMRMVTDSSHGVSYAFAVDGSSNPYDAALTYDPTIPAIGFRTFGNNLSQQFNNDGTTLFRNNLSVDGTTHSTLFTGAADAALITTGTIATARLGSGSATNNTFLRGDQTWAVVSGGGGGINTTTTGTFVIAAMNSTQTVPVTATTGIVVGTDLQISDGAHLIIGLVTNISVLSLTVKTQAIPLGTVGNTMASGAAVQSSTAPGTNTIQISDTATSPFTISTLNMHGSAADSSGKDPVDIYILSGGSTGTITGYIAGGIHASSLLGPNNVNSSVTVYQPLDGTAVQIFGTANQVLAINSFGTSPAFSLLGAANITPASLTPALLNVTNALTDTYLFGYDSASGHFKMFAQPTPFAPGGTHAQFLNGAGTPTNVLEGASTRFVLTQDDPYGNLSKGLSFVPPTGTVNSGIISKVQYNSGTVNWDLSADQPWLSFSCPIAVTNATYPVTAIDGVHGATESAFGTNVRAVRQFRGNQGYWNYIRVVSNPVGTVTINPATGPYVRIESINGNFTLAVADTTDVPTTTVGYASELTLEFNPIGVAYTVTWDASIKWVDGGSAPAPSTTSGQITIIKLVRAQEAGDLFGAKWFGYRVTTSTGGTYTDAQARTAVLQSTYLVDSATIAMNVVAGTSTSPSIIPGSVGNTELAGGIQASKLQGYPSSALVFLNGAGGWTTPPGGGGTFSPSNSNYSWNDVAGLQTFHGSNVFTGAMNQFTRTYAGLGGSVITTDLNGIYPTDLAFIDASAINISIADSFNNTGHAGINALSVQHTITNRTTGGESIHHGVDLRSSLNSGFNIGYTQITHSKRLNGGYADSTWFGSYSPDSNFSSSPDPTGITHQFTNGFARIGECNYGNAWGDFGFIDDRVDANQAVCGLEFFPDWIIGSENDGNPTKYNASWGIAIGAANSGAGSRFPKNWTGLLITENGIVPGGIGINVHGGSSNTTTTGTFTIAAVGATQTVPVTSTLGGLIVVGSDLQISDGTHKIYGHVTVVASLNLTFVTDFVLSGSVGNTMASAAIVENSPGVGINFQDNLTTGINFAGSAGGAPVGTGGGTAATFTSTGAAAITLADDQSIKFGSIWLRGHSGALQYSTNGTSWSNVTLP